MKIISVASARPNFMKIAPLMDSFSRRPIQSLLIHTGQHYDERMSDLFFRQLGIPKPDVNLGVGSGTHATQTGEVMKLFEPVVMQQKPDAVLVVGDVNSTIACDLVAAKLGVKLIHVEAGLRSYDRAMPEEINRVPDRRHQRLPLLHRAERPGQPAARGRRCGQDFHGRQRHDRHAAAQPRKG